MGPPAASAGRPLARTRAPPWLSEPAESWPPLHRTAALLEAAACLHEEDLARAGAVQGEPVVFQ